MFQYLNLLFFFRINKYSYFVSENFFVKVLVHNFSKVLVHKKSKQHYIYFIYMYLFCCDLNHNDIFSVNSIIK